MLPRSLPAGGDRGRSGKAEKERSGIDALAYIHLPPYIYLPLLRDLLRLAPLLSYSLPLSLTLFTLVGNVKRRGARWEGQEAAFAGQAGGGRSRRAVGRKVWC